MTTADTRIDEALGDIKAMLESDGYALEHRIADDALVLSIVAGPEACAECLVPKPIIVAMLEDALGPLVPERGLSLEYPADTGSH